MILVFGSTGYSGRLVVEQLALRGLSVRAAARNPERLAALRERTAGAIETVVADVADAASVKAAAEGCSLLITTVGPYSKLGDVAAGAAIECGVPYIDIAGEPAWVRRVFTELGPRAQAAGVAMIPAFGYDYVPGNLAGALLLERHGEDAARIDIAYCLAGDNERSTESFSQGTLDSLDASSKDRGFAYIDGAMQNLEGPRRKLEFEVSGTTLSAVAIGGSEHFCLPQVAPWLDQVNVSLGWFNRGRPVATAVKRSDAAERSALSEPDQAGPSERKRESMRAVIVAEARAASGEVIGRADVDGPNPYDMSGLLCGWAAEQLSNVELPGGALGPVTAFGLDELRRGCETVGLTVHLS